MKKIYHHSFLLQNRQMFLLATSCASHIVGKSKRMNGRSLSNFTFLYTSFGYFDPPGASVQVASAALGRTNSNKEKNISH